MSGHRVVYLGRRRTTTGRLAHAFRLETGHDTEGLFAFRRGSWVIGGLYLTQGDTAPDGHLQSLSAPDSWTGDRVEDTAQVAAWELLDRQAYQAHAARPAEARARHSPTYTAALADLAPLMDCARTRTEAEQIAQTIRHALIDSWYARRTTKTETPS